MCIPVCKFHCYDLWSMTFKDKLTVIAQRCCSTFWKLHMLLLLLDYTVIQESVNLPVLIHSLNAAARLLSGTREHITPILAALHGPPVNYSIRMLHTYSPTVCCWHATIIQPSAILKVWLSGISCLFTVLSGTEGGMCFNVFAQRLWTSQPNELKATDVVSGWSFPPCTPSFIAFFCHCHSPWMF